jgi:hypothetical protein
MFMKDNKVVIYSDDEREFIASELHGECACKYTRHVHQAKMFENAADAQKWAKENLSYESITFLTVLS